MPERSAKPLEAASLPLAKANGANGIAGAIARWECSNCSVVISFAPGFEAREPVGWANGHCLACRRQAAVDQAGYGERAALALARFEILRIPAAAPREIAKRVGCSTIDAGKARRQLEREGHELPAVERTKPSKVKRRATQSKPARSRHAELWARIDVELKADPHRTNREIARRQDCSLPTVAKRRKRLEESEEIPRTIRKGFATKPFDRSVVA